MYTHSLEYQHIPEEVAEILEEHFSECNHRIKRLEEGHRSKETREELDDLNSQVRQLKHRIAQLESALQSIEGKLNTTRGKLQEATNKNHALSNIVKCLRKELKKGE